MKLHEFEQKNLDADRTIIAFNSKFAHKIKYIAATSSRKGKVLGLQKFLSIDGEKPSTNPFTNKKTLSVSDIYMANKVILMVKVDNIRGDENIPLNTFIEAQQAMQAMQV